MTGWIDWQATLMATMLVAGTFVMWGLGRMILNGDIGPASLDREHDCISDEQSEGIRR